GSLGRHLRALCSHLCPFLRQFRALDRQLDKAAGERQLLRMIIFRHRTLFPRLVPNLHARGTGLTHNSNRYRRLLQSCGFPHGTRHVFSRASYAGETTGSCAAHAVRRSSRDSAISAISASAATPMENATPAMRKPNPLAASPTPMTGIEIATYNTTK